MLVFTAAPLKSAKARRLQDAGIEIAQVPARSGLLDLKAILRQLGEREILSVLLEAGPRLNASALAAQLIDRLFLFYAPKFAGHTKATFHVDAEPSKLVFREKTLHEFGSDFAVDALLHNYFQL